MATRKCPQCAEEIQEEAVVCRFCGTRFDVSPAASAAPPPAEPAAAVAPPAPGAPVGEVRAGVVATPTMVFGFYLHGLAVEATFIVVLLSWMGVRALDWGQRSAGFILELARPAPIFVVGAVAILIAWALGVRRLTPRVRDVGSRGVRASRRALKEEHGIGLLLSRRGLVAGSVVCLLIWAALEASAWWNFTRADDLGWELKPGIYAALILPIVGALGAILVLDRRGGRKVLMDYRGTVYQ